MSRRTGRLRRAIGVAASAATAAGAARAAHVTLTRRPPGGSETWTRTNHRGEPVTLLEGPALAASAAAAAALDPALPARTRAALVAAGAGAAAFGGYDDLAGSGQRRGFRGHLGALAHGEVTTGAVKLGGIGATGLTASALLGGSAADVAINAGLAAGSANLINLFDLRPGRAIKVASLAAALLATRPGGARTAAAPLGAAAALLPEDLGERAMLGDAGANALGAMLGVAAGATLSRPARLGLLALITGLTAASEVVSFTAVIQRTPVLHKLDMLGRRAPAPAQAPPPPGSGPDDDTGPLPAQPGSDTSPGTVVTRPGSAQAGPAEEAASGTHPAAP